MKRYFSLFSLISLSLCLFAIFILIIAAVNAGFAEFISGTVGYAVRIALAKTTDFLPFSLAEAVVSVSFILLVLFVVLAFVRFPGKQRAIRNFITLLSVFSLVFTAYVFTLGVSYKRIPLSEKLEFSDNYEISADSLDFTLKILSDGAALALEEISFDENGATVCPHGVAELSEIISTAYLRLDAELPELELKTFSSRAKPALSSGLLTSLEILGIYSFFSGEANVNTVYPDYTLPFSIAHEFAHQRGIARENEANFIAFLVCIRATDPYVRYSGYMNMLEYIASALGKTDYERLQTAYSDMHPGIISELKAYSEFYKQHKNEILSKISSFVNDNYLKAQGTEGVISYGMVTRLCVEYYAKTGQEAK